MLSWPRGPYVQGAERDTCRTPWAPSGAAAHADLRHRNDVLVSSMRIAVASNSHSASDALASRAPDFGDHMTTLPRHAARAGHAFALLAVIALSACHRNRTASEIEAASNEPTTIEFKNESLAQADVFVASLSSGARRIGTVFSGRTETLTIPRDIANQGSISLVARLLARSRVLSSGSIAISPGTHLSVRLPLDEKALYVLPAT
jgi:hypothetical protein